jgi:hypothetical protein
MTPKAIAKGNPKIYFVCRMCLGVDRSFNTFR